MSEAMPVVLARFPSQSQPGVAWYVTMGPDGNLSCGFPDQPESACRGFRFHRRCRHVQETADARAREASEESRAAKTPEDRKDAWRHFAGPSTRAGAIGPDPVRSRR